TDRFPMQLEYAWTSMLKIQMPHDKVGRSGFLSLLVIWTRSAVFRLFVCLFYVLCYHIFSITCSDSVPTISDDCIVKTLLLSDFFFHLVRHHTSSSSHERTSTFKLLFFTIFVSFPKEKILHRQKLVSLQ